MPFTVYSEAICNEENTGGLVYTSVTQPIRIRVSSGETNEAYAPEYINSYVTPTGGVCPLEHNLTLLFDSEFIDPSDPSNTSLVHLYSGNMGL